MKSTTRTCASVLILILCVYCKIHPARSWVIDDHGCRLPDNGSGFCTSLDKCETVIYLIDDHDYDSFEAQDILKKYACGVDELKRIKVCCPYTPLNVNSSTMKKKETDHSHHKKVKLLPKDCGLVRPWGLFNGNEANLFEFGWSVLLRYEKRGDPFMCSGSLISSRYILTAASCNFIKYKVIGVRIGEQNVRTLKDCTWEYSAGQKIEYCGPPPQDLLIDSNDFILYPEHNLRTLEHDIALIRLREAADVNGISVFTVCLPISAAEKSNHIDKYTAIGWGVTEHGLSSYDLLKVLTEKTDNSDCSETFKEIGRLTEGRMCLRDTQNGEVCVEDIGGPLMGYFTKNQTPITVQYGLVSLRTAKCGNGASIPTVYTNVAPYVGWILDNLEP